MGTHKRTQTSFNEDSRNFMYDHDVIKYSFMWQKFKPSEFNEHSEVPGIVFHAVMSNRLGWPDNVS